MVVSEESLPKCWDAEDKRVVNKTALLSYTRSGIMETADGDTLYFRRCPMDGKTCF